MKCGHDGGSYAASRGNPVSRNVIGHAPGMPQMSAAHDEGRCEDDPITPTNPIPGSEWGFNPKEAETVPSAFKHDMFPEDAYYIKPNGELIDTVAAEIVASDSPRKSGFNYGVGWGPTSKPPIYFDGVRIGNALTDIAHEASRKSWAMTIALRNVRLAEMDTEKQQAVRELSTLVANHMHEGDKELRLRMLINDLANTIEEKAPSNMVGYIPNMGLQYAFEPVKRIVKRIKAALA